MDLTYREARDYVCAAVIFLGSILGTGLAYGHAQVQLHGLAALLLSIPICAAAVIMQIAWSVAARVVSRPAGLEQLIFAWGLAAVWLMWGLALPTAIRRIWHGR